jgi:hypothetical protein
MLDDGADGGLVVWGIPVPVNANGVRIWPEEVKAIAVRKAEAGSKVAEIARDAGVNASLVYKWLRAPKSPGIPPQFVEVTPPADAGKYSATPPRTPGGECVVRFCGAEVAIPPGFPADELTGIMRAVKAAL